MFSAQLPETENVPFAGKWQGREESNNFSAKFSNCKISLNLSRRNSSRKATNWLSVPHHLKNPFDQELVYLMGGENRDFEVADFPRLGKRMVKSREKFEVYDMSNAKPFGPLDT
jgi:hypothetical protein